MKDSYYEKKNKLGYKNQFVTWITSQNEEIIFDSDGKWALQKRYFELTKRFLFYFILFYFIFFCIFFVFYFILILF